MKPTNSPTQGRPNPRKNRFKVWHFGPLFPTANNFAWIAMGFTYEIDYKKRQPTKFSANTLVFTTWPRNVKTADDPR